MRRPRQKIHTNGPIDLGLSNLIGGPGPTSPSADEPQSHSASAERQQRPYRALSEAGRWSELSSLAEGVLEGEADELSRLEARLWWVIAQKNLSSVPLSMLLGPLETIWRAVNEGCHHESGRLAEIRSIALATRTELREKLGPDFSLKPEHHVRGEPDKSPRVHSRAFSRVASLSVLTALVLIGGGYLLFAGRSSPGLASAVPLTPVSQFTPPTTEPPGPERLSRVSSLHAIALELENTPRSPGASAPASLPVNGPKSNVPSPTGSRPSSLQNIDTSGPIEPKEVREYVRRPAPPIRDVESLGGGVATAATPPFRQGRNDQKRPGLRSVIAPTKVMSGPSLRADALAELNPGEHVSVEEREGIWYKIRSKHGRVGFVLAQDLAPDR